MDKQAEFVAARLAAHVAACANIGSDPLVRAAMDDRAVAVEIAARWNEPREVVARPACSEYHYTGGIRRQAD